MNDQALLTTPWPTIDEVCNRLDVTKNVVEKWLYKCCPPIGRRVNSRDEVRLVQVGGKPARRTVRVLDPADVEEVARQRVNEVPRRDKPDRLTFREVWDEYGWGEKLLKTWAEEGVDFMDGERLVPESDTIYFRNGTGGIMGKEATIFPRPTLERIRRAEAASCHTHQDKEGVWHSEWAQQKYFGLKCVHYRTQPSPFLRDAHGHPRIIRHKIIRRVLPGARCPIEVTVDHEEDILAIKCGRDKCQHPRGYAADEGAVPFTDAEGAWYTERYAMKRFGVSNKTLATLRTKPSRHLDGRTIRFKPPGAVERPGSPRRAYLYLASDILQYVERRDAWRRIAGVEGRWGTAPSRQADGRESKPPAAAMRATERMPNDPSDGTAKGARRGGRPEDQRTQAIYELCYREYVINDNGAATVVILVNKEFGEGTIKEAAHVRLYARRFAEKNNLPRKHEKL
jgi:hypothetical protein